MQLLLKINNNERGLSAKEFAAGGIEMIMLAHSELSLNLRGFYPELEKVFPSRDSVLT
jgi:hypothetical protein